jgi:hypothetical protein
LVPASVELEATATVISACVLATSRASKVREVRCCKVREVRRNEVREVRRNEVREVRGNEVREVREVRGNEVREVRARKDRGYAIGCGTVDTSTVSVSGFYLKSISGSVS